MEAIEQHYGDGKAVKPVRVKAQRYDDRLYTGRAQKTEKIAR